MRSATHPTISPSAKVTAIATSARETVVLKLFSARIPCTRQKAKTTSAQQPANRLATDHLREERRRNRTDRLTYFLNHLLIRLTNPPSMLGAIPCSSRIASCATQKLPAHLGDARMN